MLFESLWLWSYRSWGPVGNGAGWAVALVCRLVRASRVSVPGAPNWLLQLSGERWNLPVSLHEIDYSPRARQEPAPERVRTEVRRGDRTLTTGERPTQRLG